MGFLLTFVDRSGGTPRGGACGCRDGSHRQRLDRHGRLFAATKTAHHQSTFADGVEVADGAGGVAGSAAGVGVEK